MGPVGVQEMIVIFLVALVLFGPKKLPELGKTLGKRSRSFAALKANSSPLSKHTCESWRRESESIKEVTRSYTNEIQQSYNSYDSAPYYDSGGLQLRSVRIHRSISIHGKRIRTSGR